MSKPIKGIGSSLDDLRDFPKSVQDDTWFQLRQVQSGRAPTNWRSMAVVGPGVVEIKLKDRGNEYRVMYVATFAEAVYVIHAFTKKTEKTSKRDITLAKTRYKQILRGRKPPGEAS